MTSGSTGMLQGPGPLWLLSKREAPGVFMTFGGENGPQSLDLVSLGLARKLITCFGDQISRPRVDVPVAAVGRDEALSNAPLLNAPGDLVFPLFFARSRPTTY